MTCSKRSTSFLQSELVKTQQLLERAVTNPEIPEIPCYNLWGFNTQQFLYGSEANTMVDVAVLLDPYTEYFRAVSAPI